MILPPHYLALRHENPSAFLIELYTAELYLQAYKQSKGGKPDFHHLASQLKEGDSSGASAQDFALFLQMVYEDLETQPQSDTMPRSSIGKELLKEMEEAHKRLTDEEKGNPFYKALYYPTLPALIELTRKYPQWESLGEVTRYQNIIFVYTLMEMSGKKPSEATSEALEKFSHLLNALGELMMKRQEAEEAQRAHEREENQI